MSEINPWARLREEWEIGWVKPTGKVGCEDPTPSTFIVTRSDSMSLLLKGKASEKQVTKELVGLLQAVTEGLLDDLEHDITPGQWLDTDVDD